MSCPDCRKGVVLEGEPTGHIDPNTGAYVASGPEGNTSRAILLLTDVFGLGLKNPEILADNLSKRLSCDVYAPDIFAGTLSFNISQSTLSDKMNALQVNLLLLQRL